MTQPWAVTFSSITWATASTNPQRFLREISEKLGASAALELYRTFRGQQISFPLRLLDPEKVHMAIVQEYDGTNIRELTVKYGYSEKTVRRIIKEHLNNGKRGNEIPACIS